jgi:hypothetical protein
MERLAEGGVCLRGSRPVGDGHPVSATGPGTADDAEEAIRCRACGQVVTGHEQRLAVGGSPVHTFFNPAGIVFELGCFRRAPGCSGSGAMSSEFTWFPGYLWQIVLCRNCRMHLGWYFISAEDSFFGLILARLQL